MSPHDYSIALRIRHPNIDPADVTRQLGIVPQHAWRKGEPREVEADEVGGRWFGVHLPDDFLRMAEWLGGAGGRVGPDGKMKSGRGDSSIES